MGTTTAQLPFLGKRDYLHGTTLYRHLLSHIPAGATVCFRIPKIIQTNRILVTAQSSAMPVAKPIAAKLNWRHDQTDGVVLVFAIDPSSPIFYEEYREDLVDQITRIQGKTATIVDPSPFDVVGSAVPMFKMLLKAQGLTPDGGQWMFSRLDSVIPERKFQKMELVLEDARKELVAKSRISFDGEFFGEFYFSWASTGLHDRPKRLQHG